MEKILNYIGGELIEPENGLFLDNENPSRGEVYSLVPDSREKDVLKAISEAKQAFPSWSQTPLEQREKVLRKLADLIDENKEKLILAESTDNGKPVSLAGAVDIPRSSANIRYYCSAMNSFTGQQFETDQKAMNLVVRSPRGVIGIISPWNLPLYILTWKVAPALIAGNTVVAKPSEVTPMTAYIFSQLCIEAGLPKGVLNIVHGLGPNIGDTLNTHPDVAAISFTGSTATGSIIAQQAAKSFKKVSLEMGGKNPTVIFADADLNEAVSGASRAAFSNQGQICLCGSRIFVEKPIYDEFKEKLISKAKKIRIGDPLQKETQHGAMVSKQHFDKVMSYIDLAKQEGGQILCGGNSIKPQGLNGYFVEPTLIEGLDENCRTNQEEIFGPVATLIPFETEEEAIELANSTKYGLGASVWTNNQKKAFRVSKAIDSGTVWVNTWMLRDLRVPFGGMKSSGVGREGGFEALTFMTEVKNICMAY